MNLPKQAVILCGGLGTRLKPLTNNIPKPMVEVNGNPFLFYLFDQLSSQGIKNFLILTGYLGEQISDFFGNGKDRGWEIQYSHGPVEWETARRIWEARKLLEESYLLLYSDNFVNLNLKKIYEFHYKSKKPLTLMLSKKNNGNIKVNNFGEVISYDSTRKQEGLEFVEIGYMFIKRDEVFSHFDNSNITGSFSNILSKLASSNNMAGFVQEGAYQSISDIERLRKTEKFLQNKKILLLDRDGVINKKASRGEYISSWSDFKWIPETKEALKILAKESYKFIIISNQAGVARGMVSEENLKIITKNLEGELASEGVEILNSYICVHHWDERCFCRKPSPGNFYSASNDFNFRLDKVIIVGDDFRDCQAAFNSGCKSLFLGDRRELEELNKEELPFLCKKNLLEALPDLVRFYDNL